MFQIFQKNHFRNWNRNLANFKNISKTKKIFWSRNKKLLVNFEIEIWSQNFEYLSQIFDFGVEILYLFIDFWWKWTKILKMKISKNPQNLNFHLDLKPTEFGNSDFEFGFRIENGIRSKFGIFDQKFRFQNSNLFRISKFWFRIRIQNQISP